jgi:hypothetical protein
VKPRSSQVDFSRRDLIRADDDCIVRRVVVVARTLYYERGSCILKEEKEEENIPIGLHVKNFDSSLVLLRGVKVHDDPIGIGAP